MKRFRSSLVAAVIALSMAAPEVAIAESPSPKEEAEALYREALAAMDGRDYERACPKLQGVVELVPEAIGARISLAECHEEAGRLASAWRSYVEAERSAAMADQAVRKEKARARAAALAPRLARLTITVTDATRELSAFQLWLDGAPLTPEQWDTPLPIDVGHHVISATAAGKRPREQELDIVADGDEVRLAIEGLREIKDAAPAVATGAGGAPQKRSREALQPRAHSPAGLRPSAQPDPDAALRRRIKTGGLIAGGLGLAGLGAGAALGTVAMVKRDQSNEGHCEGDRCDAAGIDLRSQSRTAGDVATGLLLAGGGLLATGVVLFVAAPASTGAVKTGLAIKPGGMALRGTW